jgi:hypothetical protein
MADAIKIQVVLDTGDVQGQTEKIKKGLEGAVDNATAAGKAAGKGYGEGFNNGSSSALQAGAQSAKKKTNELGKDLAAQANEAGKAFGQNLGGAIHAAFELNFNEVIKKLGEVKEAGARIGEILAGGGGEGLKTAAAGLEATGEAAAGASTALVAFAATVAVVVAALAAAGAAFLGLGHILAEHIIALDRLSRTTDVSVQDIATWQAAFRDAGGEANNFESSLLHLQNVSEQARQGNQKFAETLLKNGIISKDATEQWNQAVNAVGRLTDQTARVRLATELFGRENAKMILSMKGLEKGAEGINEEFKSYGENITPAAIEATRRLEDSEQKLAKAWDNFKTSIGTPAIDALDFLVEHLVKASDAFDDFDRKMTEAGKRRGGSALDAFLHRNDVVPLPESREPQILPPGVGAEGPVVSDEDLRRVREQQEARDKAELDAVIKGVKEKLSAKRQLAAAERALELSNTEQLVRQTKDANDRQIADLESSHKLGLLDYKDYYDKRLTLTRQSIQAEIDLTFKQIDSANAALRDLNAELGDLQAKRAQQLAAKDTAGAAATDAEILAVRLNLLKVSGDLAKAYADLAIKTREFRAADAETDKAVGHSNTVLGEQVELLNNYRTASDEVKESIKERAAAVRADPIFQESERLKQSIETLQKFINQPDANIAARQSEASLQAIAEVVDSDHKATLEIIKDRVLIADATIYHSTRAQAILLDHLAQQKSVTQSVGDAMISVYEGVAGAIDQGIGKLTAKLGIFGDAVREVLSGITRSVLTLFTTTLMGGRGGGPGGGGTVGGLLGGGAGGGGGILGALFPASGAAAGAGGIGGLLQGATAPQFINLSAAGGGVQSAQLGATIESVLAGGFPGASTVGGIQAPTALSVAGVGIAGGLTGIARGFFGPGAIAKGLPGAGGLSNFLAGIGGAGGLALAGLGVSLGSGLGGTSKTGGVLGAIGGGILGIGAGIAGTAFGLGATLAVALAPLLGAALIAAPFIIAAILLGRAAQRKKDEALADSYWKGAADQIVELTRGVQSDRIDGQDALQQALALRAQAVAQIGTIKTASVRESRLAHQIPDLDRVYIEPLKKAVEAQARRRATGQSIIPEFATGGYVSGVDRGYDSVLARLRPGEAVLTREQQARLGGEGALRMAGVPGFAEGGVVSQTSVNSQMVIYLDVELGVSPNAAGDLVVTGATTPQGRQVVVRTVKSAQKNREL